MAAMGCVNTCNPLAATAFIHGSRIRHWRWRCTWIVNMQICLPRRWAACAGLCLLAACRKPDVEEQLWRLRNLGQAFYENPTTQAQAVEQFRKALNLAPGAA